MQFNHGLVINATLPPRLREEPDISSDELDPTLGLGSVIRQIRKRRDMLQSEVADRAYMARATVANIECGRQAISIKQLKALADALDMVLVVRLEPRAEAQERT